MDAMDTLPLAVAIVPLLLIGLGLLAILLPETLLRSLVGQRDPVAASMLPLSFGLIFLGLLLAAFNLADSVRGWGSRNWQPVHARIFHSALVQTMQPRSSNPAWRPDVRYAYRYDDRDYTGHRIAAYTTASSDRTGTIEWLQRHYPVGTEVVAHVNPDAPAQAVLERGGSPWSLLMVGVGLVLAGSGAWLLRMALRPPEPAPPPRNRRVPSRTPRQEHRR